MTGTTTGVHVLGALQSAAITAPALTDPVDQIRASRDRPDSKAIEGVFDHKRQDRECRIQCERNADNMRSLRMHSSQEMNRRFSGSTSCLGLRWCSYFVIDNAEPSKSRLCSKRERKDAKAKRKRAAMDEEWDLFRSSLAM